MIVIGEKPTSPRYNKQGKMPQGTYVLNFYAIISKFLFLYMFMTSHWKGLEENYNFLIENTLMNTHMQKL
jgi:hypothetical protein